MSLTRTVNLKNLDMECVQEAARDLGYRLGYNRKHKLWGSKMSEVNAEVVVTNPSESMEIGFIRNGEDIEISYDHMIGETYGKLMSTYFEKMVNKRSKGRYRMINKTDANGKVTLNLRRV